MTNQIKMISDLCLDMRSLIWNQCPLACYSVNVETAALHCDDHMSAMHAFKSWKAASLLFRRRQSQRFDELFKLCVISHSYKNFQFNGFVPHMIFKYSDCVIIRLRRHM